MLEMRSSGPTRADIERGYEGTVITVRGFIYFLGVFIVFVALIHGIIWYLFAGMSAVADKDNRARFQPTVLKLDPVPPPAPNLQPSKPHPKVDWQDMDELRTGQQSGLLAAKWDRDPRTGRLIVPPQIVEQVGRLIETSRKAPTTLPYSSGASGLLGPAATPGEPGGSAPDAGVNQQPPAPAAATPAAPAPADAAHGAAAVTPAPATQPAAVAPAAHDAAAHAPATLPATAAPAAETQPAATPSAVAQPDGAPAEHSKDPAAGTDAAHAPTVGRENP